MEIKFDGEFDGVDFLLNEIPLDFYLNKETPEERKKRISQIKDFTEKELIEMLTNKLHREPIVVQQNIEDLVSGEDLEMLRSDFSEHMGDWDYKRKSNNWLKLHGKPKRRKPFKREALIIDEFGNLTIVQCGRRRD